MIAYTSESGGRPGQRARELGAERRAGARPPFDEAAPDGQQLRQVHALEVARERLVRNPRPRTGSTSGRIASASSAVTRWMVERMQRRPHDAALDQVAG